MCHVILVVLFDVLVVGGLCGVLWFLHLYWFLIASVLILYTYVMVSLLSWSSWPPPVFCFSVCLLFALQDTTFNNHGPQTPPSQIRPQGTQEQAPLQAQGWQEALSPPPQEEVLFRLSGNDLFPIICKPDFHPVTRSRVAHPVTRVLDHRFSSNW